MLKDALRGESAHKLSGRSNRQWMGGVYKWAGKNMGNVSFIRLRRKIAQAMYHCRHSSLVSLPPY